MMPNLIITLGLLGCSVSTSPQPLYPSLPAGDELADPGETDLAMYTEPSEALELPDENLAADLLGTQLLENATFEDAMTGWEVVGDCLLSDTLATLSAPEGSWFLRGDESAEDCVARQTLTVSDHAGLQAAIDTGDIAVEMTGQVATWYDDGIFQDRALLRVVFRDAEREELGRIESLVGGDHSWQDRTLKGVVPHSTAFIDAEVEIRWARGLTNDAAVDNLVFTLRTNGPATPAITELPMLQLPTPDTITLQWGSDHNTAPARVVFGESGSPLELTSDPVLTVEVDDTHYVHTARLSGLERATRYQYQVSNGEETSSIYDFMSAPENDQAVRFGLFADNQDAVETFTDQVIRFSEADVDAVLVAGDMVERGSEAGHWSRQWYQPMAVGDLAQTVPVIYARGNHDEHSPSAMAYTATPDDAPWYALRYGEAFIVVLNTELSRHNFAASETHPSDSSDLWEEQTLFLQEALDSDDSRDAAWRFVMMHQPPYTAARHDDWSNGKGEVREYWVEVFEDYDVDLVIGGHYHSYQRGEQEGVTYLVSGGGGHTLDSIDVEDWAMMEVVEMTHHIVIMDVNAERVSWQAITVDDEVIDEHTLTR